MRQGTDDLSFLSEQEKLPHHAVAKPRCSALNKRETPYFSIIALLYTVISHLMIRKCVYYFQLHEWRLMAL